MLPCLTLFRLKILISHKQPFCVFLRNLNYFFPGNPFDLRDLFRHIGQIPGTVPLSPVGNRRQIGTVRLQQNTVHRYIRHTFPQFLCILERHHTAHSDQIPHCQKFPCALLRIGKAMDNSPLFNRLFRFHNIQRILCRIPGMDDYRKRHFIRQRKLSGKPLFLHFPLHIIPVIIQPDLPHCQNLFMSALFFQPLEVIFI